MTTPTTPQEFYEKENGDKRTTVDPADNAFVADGEGVDVPYFLRVFAQLKLCMTREELAKFAEMKRAAELARQVQRGRRA